MATPRIHIHVLPDGGGIALESPSLGGDVVVLDGRKRPGAGFAQRRPRNDVAGIEQPEPDSYSQALALVGVLWYGDDEPYLLAATSRELVCRIRGSEVFKVTGGLVVPLFDVASMQPLNSSLRAEFVDFANDLLHSGHLYYSETFDLTRSLQKQATHPDVRTDEFVFNWAAQQTMKSEAALGPFAKDFIGGFIGSCGIGVADSGGKSAEYTVVLVARYSRERLGTRYTRRGLDAEGHAANFVEMEQIVWRNDDPQRLASFVQVRGSVPTVWKQTLDLNWKPKMSVADQGRPEVIEASKKHFGMLEKEYLSDSEDGKIVCVDLLNEKGFELPLSNAYREVVANLKDPRIEYEAFPVNKYCKRMNYGPLSVLLDRLHGTLVSNGFFVGGDGKTDRLENGAIRTSCLDSLDRTNMVATLFAKDVLIYQLAALGANPSGEPFSTVENPPAWVAAATDATMFPMNNLYADAGDAISLIYSGTGHMKGDIVRTGKRQWIMGSWLDGRNSLSRYYLNNFRDGVKQDVLDIWNGNVSGTDLMEDERQVAIRSAEEPPSFMDSDGVGVIRLPSISDMWFKAKTYSNATGMSSFLALLVLFSKWIAPRKVDSIFEFFLSLAVSFWMVVFVHVFGVDRDLVVNRPVVKRDGTLSEYGDGGGRKAAKGKKKE
ncbi:SacI homology domain-containing protein [Hyaloraphidium curvatum]|nr:SacI homology domain-containing protein [Hyaloraphidium curvatum]